jgi:hypothetical protein
VGRNLDNCGDKLLKLLAFGVASLHPDLFEDLVNRLKVKVRACHRADVLVRLVIVVNAFEIVHVAIETVNVRVLLIVFVLGIFVVLI